jgi:hypothetical protein
VIIAQKHVYIRNEYGSQLAYFRGTNGQVAIGEIEPYAKLHVDGDIVANGSVSEWSDERLKTDIVNVQESVLDELDKINVVTYAMIADEDRKKKLGVIAQNLEESALFSQLIVEHGGYKSVNYHRLSVLLLKGMQEQQAQIRELVSRVDKLEKP